VLGSRCQATFRQILRSFLVTNGVFYMQELSSGVNPEEGKGIVHGSVELKDDRGLMIWSAVARDGRAGGTISSLTWLRFSTRIG
jgi:hypothetical protein